MVIFSPLNNIPRKVISCVGCTDLCWAIHNIDSVTSVSRSAIKDYYLIYKIKVFNLYSQDINGLIRQVFQTSLMISDQCDPGEDEEEDGREGKEEEKEVKQNAPIHLKVHRCL